MPSDSSSKRQSRTWALHQIKHRDPHPGYYQNGQQINVNELSETELRFMLMTGEMTVDMLDALKDTPRGQCFFRWIEQGREAASRRPSQTRLDEDKS
ncbi:hypothetical protein KEM54_006480 [Ascosphaera aggregata]|nr:hypothetical protein KEM54_006480 [Ascosphaera aggregata]